MASTRRCATKGGAWRGVSSRLLRRISVVVREARSRLGRCSRTRRIVRKGSKGARTGICLDLRSAEGSANSSYAHKAVQRESWLYYGAIISELIPKDGDERPLILVDWTDINKLWTSLAAPVVTEGRGIVICAETHPVKKNNNARIETGFLKRLKRLLPENCRPIVISDAGFRGPWNRKILDAEWDFVGRLRGTVQLQECSGETGGVGWQSVKKMGP